MATTLWRVWSCLTGGTGRDPDLVCKLVVQTVSGKKYRGSGYPITPNRIITAAHVVADAAPVADPDPKGDARQIILSFGPEGQTIDTPVYIEWCGVDDDVDVAVLRCQLPSELQPTHRLLTKPPDTPVKWFARGYTDFGKQNWPGGKDDYHGELTKFGDSESTVPLDCEQGLITSVQWQGGSGSVAFDSATAQTALAVITDFQGGKKLDQLVGVPICYLLNAAPTQDGFRRAIRFDAYQRREDHRTRVIAAAASRLKALNACLLKRVADAVNQLVEESTSKIDLEKAIEVLAKETATCIVDRCAVTDVVADFVGLMQELEQEDSARVADIIDHLLPLNYAPGLVHRLRDQLADGRVGLVENEVATRTLAEIIMAGYDQQPARFATLTSGNAGVRGRTALDPEAGPEEGPSDPGSHTTGLLRAVRNFLGDLVALKDVTPVSPNVPPQRRGHDGHSDADLHREIAGYATRLRGVLQGMSRVHQGRTVYCVLMLPPEETPERRFRVQMLGAVRQHVPQLVFVELMPPDRAEALEFEVEYYIQARLIRFQQGREP
jgi:hypothetical protein